MALSIIVPVYGQANLVKRLAKALALIISEHQNSKDTKDFLSEIIFINDKPADEECSQALINIATNFPLPARIIKHQVNQGFVRSVNAGIEAANKLNDIVIINSDTIPQFQFIAGLNDSINHLNQQGIAWASLTPSSNNATLATLPKMCREFDSYRGVMNPEVAAFLTEKLFTPGPFLLECPVGVGFCMVMSRKALDQIGGFSEEFSPGYCEEVDWCLRSAELGFKHYFVPRVFVHHDGGASFSAGRKKLMEDHAKKILIKYPPYEHAIHQFLHSKHNHIYHDRIAPFWEFLERCKGADITLSISQNSHQANLSLSEKTSVEISPKVIDGTILCGITIDGAPWSVLSLDSFHLVFSLLLENKVLNLISLILNSSGFGGVAHGESCDYKPYFEFVKMASSYASEKTIIVSDYSLICTQPHLLYNDEIFCAPGECIQSLPCRTCNHGSKLEKHRKYATEIISQFDQIVFPSASSQAIFNKVFPTHSLEQVVSTPAKFIEIEQKVFNIRPGKPNLVYLGVDSKEAGSERFKNIVFQFEDKFNYFVHGSRDKFPGVPFIDRKPDLSIAESFPCFVLLIGLWPKPDTPELLEAIAAGCPILTTRENHQIVEIVQKLRCGKVFFDMDELKQYLSLSVEELIRDIYLLAPAYEVINQLVGEPVNDSRYSPSEYTLSANEYGK